ncbi:hypothetical protein Aduo_013536 [Ancylostoma duodenale]
MQTASDILCGPHFSGVACDWPICVHGDVDPVDKTCWCHNNYAPPFCEFCLPGYWGEACDREILPAMHEPLLPAFFTHIVIYLLVVLVIVLTYFMFDRYRSRPPPYKEVIKDAPPPYYLV